MTDPTPGELIVDGLGRTDTAGVPGDVRRARRAAASFRYDAHYEHLLELRDADAPRWDDISPGTRIAVGLYESQRQVAADHGVDVTTPPAT